jgi:hypothetical protein
MSDATRIAEPDDPEARWPSFALPRGTVVNGYRIERVLGSGGFGITYLALDLLEQRFAVKEYYPRQFAAREHLTVRPTSREDAPLFDECRERFLREARALVKLGQIAGASDGIVRVQTYFEAFGTCFLVMDYVEGRSLANVLRQEPGGLAPERVRSLLGQLLDSIRVVHRAGLVHRDIKPANVILRDSDRLVLIDFGSTRQAALGETTTYTQIYTGGYAPPEQMLGLRQGEFSDIYAIGAVCYRAIGGMVVDALSRQHALAEGRPDPQPSAVSIGAGRYSNQLLAAIDAALAVDVERRPQSADAMLDILGAGEPTPARVAPAGASGARRVTWITAGGVAALGVAAAIYLLLPSPAPPPKKVGAPAQTATAPEPAQTAAVPVPAPPAPVPIQQTPPPREAIVAPPPSSVSEPAPPLVPSPFERAQDAAKSLSCSALRLAAIGDGVRASGLAAPGKDLERFLAGLHDLGRVADDVTRIDQWACAVLSTMAPVVRGTWEANPPAFTLRLDQPNAVRGAHVAISVATPLPALYIDLYQADGLVRHLFSPAQSGGTVPKTIEWLATQPLGPRLIVALGAPLPLDVGARPETEPRSDYLDALRARLANGGTRLAGDLAMVVVRSPEPVAVRPPPSRPANARSQKCANIVSRAQLGETLSDAELAALRTECRS